MNAKTNAIVLTQSATVANALWNGATEYDRRLIRADKANAKRLKPKAAAFRDLERALGEYNPQAVQRLKVAVEKNIQAIAAAAK